MTNRIKIILFLISIFNSSNGYSKSIIMATANWQPFVGEELHKNGFVAEITREALSRNGHSLSIEFVPWARALVDVKNGKYHALLNTSINKDIENDYFFSKQVLGSGELHFLAPVKTKFNITKPEDLSGIRLGFIRGYQISDELIRLKDKNIVEAIEVTRVEQLIKMLRKGRIDIILENYLVAKYVSNVNFPDNVFDLKIVGKDLVDGRLFVGWSKAVSGSKEMRDDFDNAMSEMYKDGTINKIKKEFGIN